MVICNICILTMKKTSYYSQLKLNEHLLQTGGFTKTKCDTFGIELPQNCFKKDFISCKQLLKVGALIKIKYYICEVKLARNKLSKHLKSKNHKSNLG